MNPRMNAALTQPWLTDVLPTVIRIILGVLLVYHGTDKIFSGLDVFIQGIEAKGWPMPMVQGFLAAYIEFAGGVLLIVGLLTRPAAFASIILFSIIFFLYSATDPFPKKEKALVFLVLSVYTFLMGPGKASVDAILFRQNATPAKD